jgi:outer membrane protein OmpA-like peptidoglycan-associated protein
LGARTESISDNYIVLFQNNESHKIWISYFISGSNYKDKVISTETFTMQSNSIRIGATITKSGGIFAGYKNITAKQDEDRANASDIEVGVYKEFEANEININVMASLGLQTIDVKNGISFNTKSIRFSADANAPIFIFADIFGGIRGAYVKADDIKDGNIEIKSSDYMTLDLLAGLKRDFEVSDRLSLITKGFVGLKVMGQEMKTDDTLEQIKGISQDAFFVGINGGINYSLNSSVDFFAGINTQFSSLSTVYGGYFGFNYKFAALAPKDIEARRLEKLRKATLQNIREEQRIINRSANRDSKIQKEEILDSETIKAAKKQWALEREAIRKTKEQENIDMDNEDYMIEEEEEEEEENIPPLKIERIVFNNIGNQSKNQSLRLIPIQNLNLNLNKKIKKVSKTPKTNKELIKEAQYRRKNAIKPFKSTYRLFNKNSSKLSASAKSSIKKIAKNLKKMDFDKVTVEGHGDNKSKKILSRKRANAVYLELIKQGIPASKITYVNYAYLMPIASNKTAKGRNLNNRVEIFVEK